MLMYSGLPSLANKELALQPMSKSVFHFMASVEFILF